MNVVVFLLFLLLGGCSLNAQGKQILGFPGFGSASSTPSQVASGRHSSGVEVRDRQGAIDKYLAGRDLDVLEGVWIWSDNAYEVVITKNTLNIPNYNYVAIVTDTRNENWSRGNVKFLVKETASETVFTGLYYMGDRQESGATFVMTDPNIIEFSLPSGPYGRLEKTLLIRVYPKGRAVGGPARVQNTSSGTGFYVTPELIATNYHVVANADTITVDTNGITSKAEIYLQDHQNDLALLKVLSSHIGSRPGSSYCLALTNPDTAKPGDNVYTLGYPLSNVLATTVNVGQGLINNTMGLNNDPRMFQISVPIQPGNSGSPLFDAYGGIIGIITSTLNNKHLLKGEGITSQNVNFAIKSSYLHSMLALANSKCSSPLSPISPSLTATQIQEQFSQGVVRVQTSR